MFKHANFAVHGLYPGMVSHRSVANLGHFEIEVIIEPVGPSGGGGGYYSPSGVSPKYKIKIRVTRKGKVWEYESIVNQFTAKVFAKVVKQEITVPLVEVTSRTVEKNEPTIKVTIK